jgi:ubiquinone/menaquinone biosynthesis C-methylase UbiE
MAKTEAFDLHTQEYENWFVENKFVFKSELKAVTKAIPQNGIGVEIGMGSGIFAEPLGIKEGVEPSEAMIEYARKRGLNIIKGVAENLPYKNESKDFVLMVTSICFVDNVKKSFFEANRILKKGGELIIGFVDKDSPIGKIYLQNKEKSLFYKEATFFGTEELISILKETNFTVIKTYQTVFGLLSEIKEEQKVSEGYGEGSFVVIKAKKDT